MNNLTISGKCISDIKYHEGEKPRANFTVAVYDPSGKMNEKGYRDSLLFSVTVFGRTAEIVNDRGFKGAEMIVNGRVGMWTGDRGSSLSVTANDVEVVSRPTDRTNSTPKPKRTTSHSPPSVGLNDDGSIDPFSMGAE
jgi:single-stranded DNA-binding protein